MIRYSEVRTKGIMGPGLFVARVRPKVVVDTGCRGGGLYRLASEIKFYSSSVGNPYSLHHTSNM